MRRINIADRLACIGLTAPDILATYACEGPAMIGLVRIAAGSTDHFWERHGDGDELLFLLEGRAEFTSRDAASDDTMIEVGAGDIVLLSREEAHRARVQEDLCLLFITPRDGNVAWSDDPAVPLRHG
ncbi:MAG: cupin domain-containing protein [Candidatus Sphingomonas phytovorans]|nr:cupin domain-containing protein [Sphingomonas sp.]WEK00865.1 MAG: cupin domain-containing protein [Sphingomonas sp.]